MHIAEDSVILFPVTNETYAAGSLSETGFSILRMWAGKPTTLVMGAVTYFSTRVEIEENFVTLVRPIQKSNYKICIEEGTRTSLDFTINIYNPLNFNILKLPAHSCIIEAYGEDKELPTWISTTYEDAIEIERQRRKEYEEIKIKEKTVNVKKRHI